jgi:hypothetical protein
MVVSILIALLIKAFLSRSRGISPAGGGSAIASLAPFSHQSFSIVFISVFARHIR